MKPIKLILSTLIGTLLGCFSLNSSAESASGSAIIPHYATLYSNPSVPTFFHLFISNITDSNISVKVTLYGADGAIIYDNDNTASQEESTGDIIYRTDVGTSVSSWSDALTNESYSFVLGPKDTIRVDVRDDNYEYGYGRIEWSQSNSSAIAGLVAYGRTYHKGDHESKMFLAYESIMINQGMPF